MREVDSNAQRQKFSNPEKKLTDYQCKILKKIVENALEIVSYRNPGRNLGELATSKNHNDFLNAIRSLESDFGVLAFDPSLKSGFFDKGGYKVNLEKAKKLYSDFYKED
jgi:hypothetical protein